MAKEISSTTSTSPQLSPEARAAALWAFVEAKAPRFTMDAAIRVLYDTDLRSGEDPKSQAKRLTKALKARGITLKHSNALQAVARIQGDSSWYADENRPSVQLLFQTLDTSQIKQAEFSSWSDLAQALRTWIDQVAARGQLPLNVLTVSLSGRVFRFSTPVPAEGEDGRHESWPLATIAPLMDQNEWLEGMPAALEKLRRHLEAAGKTAVLDGYAVIRLCADSKDMKGMPASVTVEDISNSELVLVWEDNEHDPQGAFEIARGDEITCWHQLELWLKDEKSGITPDINIAVPSEGVGAWIVNGKRYVWFLETLKPNEYVPGIVKRQIGPEDCDRLRHRYLSAKRIHGRSFKHHDMTKHVDYLTGVPETYRVDLHYVLRQLNDVSLTWDGYIKQFGIEPIPMQAQLPVGFVLKLIQDLALEKPNSVFARPNLSEMTRLSDDGLLRSLMPRVDFVRYQRPRDLDDTTARALLELVEEFSGSLKTQKLVAAGGLVGMELPYMLYASDALECLTAATELGFAMYVAVLPHLMQIPEHLLSKEVNAWPWALGNALYLRFERDNASTLS